MASIRQLEKKFKWLVTDERTFFVLLLLLTACAAYGLGRLSVTGVPVSLFTEAPSTGVVQLFDAAAEDDRLTTKPERSTSTTVVGSRNGTRYYTPNCSGVARIAEENRLYFIDRHRAQAAGYTASRQCFD